MADYTMKEYKFKMKHHPLCSGANKGTAVPGQAWRVTEGSRRMRLLDFKRIYTRN